MAYKKCPDCGLTLNLNDERDDDHWERCPKRPDPEAEPPSEP